MTDAAHRTLAALAALATLAALAACGDGNSPGGGGGSADGTDADIEDAALPSDGTSDADDASPDGDDDADAYPDPDANDPACPATSPWLSAVEPVSCPDSPAGLTCAWPAEGCPPGERPPNVCRCEGTPPRWTCDDPFQTCWAAVEGGALALGTRPLPEHRPAAAPCEDPADAPSDTACVPVPGIGVPPSFCETAGDCEGDEVCLLVSHRGPTGSCQCTEATCLVDADCGAAGVCACGSLDPTLPCGGLTRRGCAHACRPAACRVDADCGPGGLCSPSRDLCNAQVERFACHDPAAATCLSDAECWGPNRFCRFDPAADGWRCAARPLCD